MRSSRWNRGRAKLCSLHCLFVTFFRGLWLRCCMHDIWVVGLLRPPPPASRTPFPNFECVQAEYTREYTRRAFHQIAQSPAKSEMTPSHETNAPLALGPKIMGTLQGPVLALSHTLLTLRMPAFA